MTSNVNTRNDMTTIKTPEAALQAYPTVADLDKALRRTASLKCNARKRYNKQHEVAAIEAYEEILRTAKASIAPTGTKKSVPDFTADDIAGLDWEATNRALKSIQSKKSNSKHLTATPGDNDTYRKACEVEALLLDHKATLEPGSTNRVTKSQLAALVSQLEADPDMDAIDALKALL